VIDAAGNLKITDTIPAEFEKSVAALQGNQWLLRSPARNGNYFLAYGLSTPLRLPIGLTWNFAMLDGNGHRLWEYHLPENLQISSLDMLANGHCVLVGYEITQRGDKNICIAQWNEYGQELWHRTLGGKGDDVARSLAHDASGNIYIGGFFSADSTFLGNSADLTGKDQDGFIACFTMEGKQKFWLRQRGNGFCSVEQLAVNKLGQLWFVSIFSGKDWLLNPFGLNRVGKQDMVVGLITPDQKSDQESPLRVFPNPARELAYFGLTKVVGKARMLAKLHHKDGTILQQMWISPDPGSSYRFNVSNTKPGAYYISVEGKRSSFTERILVE